MTKFLRISTTLAVLGLSAVTLLTVPDLSDVMHAVLVWGLVAIWGIYVVALLVTLWGARSQPRSLLGVTGAADILAVAAPLIGPLLGLSVQDSALFCAIWVLKLVSGSAALQLIGRVIAIESRNLLGVLAVFGVVLFTAALLAFVLERDAQPKLFGSIPGAMWWAVTTLTTTGYGDEIPSTVAGRILAGLVMMCGIAVFALWAGILATGFAEELKRRDFLRNWQLVAKVPLFEHVGPADLLDIARSLKPRTFASNSLICRKGDPGDEMYFIIEGEVSVATSPPVTLTAGQFFGEMALIAGSPRTTNVAATTPVALLALHASDFHTLLARSPKAAAAIKETAAARRASLAVENSGVDSLATESLATESFAANTTASSG
jgi:voltage-gated potassium channel